MLPLPRATIAPPAAEVKRLREGERGCLRENQGKRSAPSRLAGVARTGT